MRFFSSLKPHLIIGLILVLFVLGFIGFNLITKTNDKKPTLTSSQINKVKTNLGIITSTPTHSSIPLDQVKGHEKEYNEILQMGEPVVYYFIDEFKKGNLEGSNEWLTAWICNEILGDKNPVKIWALDNKNGWDSGRDWYEKYIKIKNIR